MESGDAHARACATNGFWRIFGVSGRRCAKKWLRRERSGLARPDDIQDVKEQAARQPGRRRRKSNTLRALIPEYRGIANCPQALPIVLAGVPREGPAEAGNPALKCTGHVSYRIFYFLVTQLHGPCGAVTGTDENGAPRGDFGLGVDVSRIWSQVVDGMGVGF